MKLKHTTAVLVLVLSFAEIYTSSSTANNRNVSRTVETKSTEKSYGQSKSPVRIERTNTRGMEGTNLQFKCLIDDPILLRNLTANNETVPETTHLAKSGTGSAPKTTIERLHPAGIRKDKVLPRNPVHWRYMLNETHSVSISEFNNSHISSENGWLNFTSLTLDLAGKYVCTTPMIGHNLIFNNTIEVVVFKQYLVLGIVVMAINGFLICLFLFCMVYSTIKSRLVYSKKNDSAEHNVKYSYDNIKTNQKNKD